VDISAPSLVIKKKNRRLGHFNFGKGLKWAETVDVAFSISIWAWM
jgi:hypothetical protein